MEQVEQLRIDLVDIARPEVSQEIVDRCQGVGQIGVAAEILDREPLAGVRVREAKRANTCGIGNQASLRRQPPGTSRTREGPHAA